MSREYRGWNSIGAVKYFNEHYKGKITTRRQLQEEDSGLYRKLRIIGKLDEILPNKHENFRDFSQVDPVQHFNQHYKGKITTRKQLKKEDGGLYEKLRKLGKLDEILPSRHESHRDFSEVNPIQFFNEHYKGKISTRSQLKKEDPTLYEKLLKLGKLDEIFKKKSSLDDILNRYVEGGE